MGLGRCLAITKQVTFLSEIRCCANHGVDIVTLLSPLWGLVWWDVRPTGCAMGYILAPLRGLSTVAAVRIIGGIVIPLCGLMPV